MKIWAGPTPYDTKRPYGRETHCRVEGYRAAMNSPEVRAMVGHLDELRDAWLRGVISEHDGKGGTRSNRNAEVLAAYEAGLKWGT